MKSLLLITSLTLLVSGVNRGSEPGWRSTRLIADFHAEGAAVGDIDGDGQVDIAYGPFWLAGPDFNKPIRYADGEDFQGHQGYSDNFFSYLVDANGDDRNDILVYGFPGKEARLYIHPGTDKLDGTTRWSMHIIADEISNESPAFVDLVPGGLPEIVCTHDTSYGYYQAGEDATLPWTWRAISAKGEAGGRFEHGLGVGDVNGDGHADIIQRQFWYENPGDPATFGNWKKTGWAPMASAGGAQILVNDLDGDGDNDLISSLAAHGYGLAWYEQVEPGKFARHDLMGESSTDSPYGVCFSQLHALALADMDGDGRQDFVTGKRYFAHQGKDPGGLQEPVLYWFRNTENPDGGIEFVPHLVHRDSGVGTEITVTDLNGDGRPDIVSGNKKGLTIHLQQKNATAAAAGKWKVDGGRPQDNYGSGLSAQQALARTEAADGFSVDLIAAEPDITQPIAMCFDARGRIWLLEGHTYPERQADGEGRDRIVILEDSDGDTSFETRKVFAEGINLGSALEVGFGGVFVGAAPYLMFFPDKDKNDKADGEPEILLDGWGYQDTHETLNSFTWGPDGWLYGCHGVFTYSEVGKPGAPAGERTKINAGVWRFHPVSRKFEVFANGTSNPWGVEFNEYGDCFISACVIPHFYHLSEGGRYQRQGGQHYNPYTFDDIKTIADHAHYVGNIRDHAFWGDNKTDRPAAPSDTSALGGGHAHCGLAIYLADEFPAEYRGEMFIHNLHGHRIVREHIEQDGSGYTARHRPDFLLTNNHDFVGVGVMLGPDGALYYSDWVDPQTCHHRDVEKWDRSNGRIFRVRYGDAKPTRLDLPDRSDTELVAALAHSNAFVARQAQRLLQERAAENELEIEATYKALTELARASPLDVPLRLRILWTRHVCGLLTPEDFASALADPDEHIRGWAVSLVGRGKAGLPADALSKLEQMAGDDFSLVVRRHLASKLQRLPFDQRWGIVEGLIRDQRSGHDRNLPLLTWYGVEPMVEENAEKAFSLLGQTDWSQFKDFVGRRAAITEHGRQAILTSLSSTKSADEFVQRSRQLLGALTQLPPVKTPPEWRKARQHGEAFEKQKPDPALGDVLSRLGARFGDADFFPKWRAVVGNGKSKPADREQALDLLALGGDPELAPIAREALKTPALRRAALAALRAHPGAETAEALVACVADLPLDLRNEAINLLAARADMALPLLRAVDEERLPAALISPVLLDQFERFDDPKIHQLVKNNWVRGSAGIELDQLAAAIEAWKKKLSPLAMAKANAVRGRQTFTATCGICHKLFGEGIALGPDLTGSNRADLGYLLENVLAPSAVVGKDYLLNIFSLKNGTVISGIVREQTPESIRVALPGGTQIDIAIADIAERKEIAQSLMPGGLFDILTMDQVADLVSYLASAQQVPIAGEGSVADPSSSVALAEDGIIRIEGESLLPQATASGGKVIVQPMAGFGRGWSENKHLWWTGGTPDQILALKLSNGKLIPGNYDLWLFPTTAKDYAQVKISINGQVRIADLYSDSVLPGDPLHFKKVNISPAEPLHIDIHITGANPAAVPRYMVGIDRIELHRN